MSAQHGSNFLYSWYSDSHSPQATSTASVILSPGVSSPVSRFTWLYTHMWPIQSKLVVLKSLSRFLSTAVASQSTMDPRTGGKSSYRATPTWFFSSSFPSSSMYKAFDELLYPSISESSSKDLRSWRRIFDHESGDENFVTPSDWVLEPPGDNITMESMYDSDWVAIGGGSSSGSTAATVQLLVSLTISLMHAKLSFFTAPSTDFTAHISVDFPRLRIIGFLS